MESTLYGIFTLIGFVSEISLIRCAHSFDFRYFTNSCENPIRTCFPWSNLYLYYLYQCNYYAFNLNKWKGSLYLRNETCFPSLHSLVKTDANIWENLRADQWKPEMQSRVFTCSRILTNFAEVFNRLWRHGKHVLFLLI